MSLDEVMLSVEYEVVSWVQSIFSTILDKVKFSFYAMVVNNSVGIHYFVHGHMRDN